MSLQIRPAQDADLSFIIDLMNHFIVHDPGLYSETTIRSEEAQAWMMARSTESSPMLVALSASQIIGVAFARPFRHQSGSAHVWESSVYLDPQSDVLRTGIGSRLLQSLLEQLSAQGTTEVIAVIDEDNRASIQFHQKHGFLFVGVIQRAGFKFGRYRNAHLYQFSQNRSDYP